MVQLCHYLQALTWMKGLDPMDLTPSTSVGFLVSNYLLSEACRSDERASTASVLVMLGRPAPRTPAWLSVVTSAPFGLTPRLTDCLLSPGSRLLSLTRCASSTAEKRQALQFAGRKAKKQNHGGLQGRVHRQVASARFSQASAVLYWIR